MFIPILLVLAQAAVPAAEAEQSPLKPGNQFFWYMPCTVQEGDPANRMEYWTSGYLTLIGKPQKVIRCVQPGGSSNAVMLSQTVADVGFLLVYSAEMDGEDFPDLARKGLVAHEIAHEQLERTCREHILPDVRTACEAVVDAAAARLAGTDAVRAAMEEYHKLTVRLAAANLERSREELLGVRRTLLEATDDAVPAPVDPTLTEVAREIARSAGLPYEPTVHVPPLWEGRGIVNVTAGRRGNRIAIRVSPILAREMYGDGIRAMLAHELAHPQNVCKPDPETLKYPTYAEEIACEHAADALSARWVGRTAVLQGLLQLTDSSWDWRYTTDVSTLMERIRLMHDRTDIP